MITAASHARAGVSKRNRLKHKSMRLSGTLSPSRRHRFSKSDHAAFVIVHFQKTCLKEPSMSSGHVPCGQDRWLCTSFQKLSLLVLKRKRVWTAVAPAPVPDRILLNSNWASAPFRSRLSAAWTKIPRSRSSCLCATRCMTAASCTAFGLGANLISPQLQ